MSGEKLTRLLDEISDMSHLIINIPSIENRGEKLPLNANLIIESVVSDGSRGYTAP